jgi:hypothetical protein
MKTVFNLFALFIILLTSCKKESNKKYCWQLIDANGADLVAICDKTEAELLDCVKNNTCGTFFNGGSITSCNYYKLDGEKFCWKVNGIYLKDFTENKASLYARCFYGNAALVKADSCLTCIRWYNREKKTYKPNSTVTYSPITVQNYCGDTLRTIFQGRQIIRKDDADSLIAIQFSQNGLNW